jgi:hypothetical protein
MAARWESTGLSDAEILAWLLDNSIPIPGTGRRIGLDAVVGLVPGLGDLLSGGLGLLVVIRGVQRGLPRVVLAHMLANVAIDFVAGAIPVIGDAFDLWFKSNARNVDLLRRHSANRAASTTADWAFFGLLAAGMAAVGLAIAWLIWSLIGALVS